jgi:dihydroneopterin aldolase / 2-amino-4-hydroxy-6-hydroxymethyldihydropteridine diphosphokinase / dihydropteroate synthase
MAKVLPFPQYPLPQDALTIADTPNPPPTSTIWTYPISLGPRSLPPQTRIMATLNATPDSFSDGSQHNSTEGASAYVASALAAGADIIDVGGYSTRPGAAYVSPEEEIARVVPAIRLCRSATTTPVPEGSSLRNIPISVDTFRAEVAARAIEAGANCINDVYAFTGPTYPPDETIAEEHRREMRSVARQFAVPVILMHSRGDAGSNKDYSAYEQHASSTQSTVSSAVVEGVRAELGAKVNAVIQGRGGVRRWLVVVDPGVGFSKTLEGNVDIIRYASSLTAVDLDFGRHNPLAGFPQLIGTSRKSYLGAVLSQTREGENSRKRITPAERDWATVAAVVTAVQQGAMIVRVHNVQAMSDVVTVARTFLK